MLFSTFLKTLSGVFSSLLSDASNEWNKIKFSTFSYKFQQRLAEIGDYLSETQSPSPENNVIYL